MNVFTFYLFYIALLQSRTGDPVLYFVCMFMFTSRKLAERSRPCRVPCAYCLGLDTGAALELFRFCFSWC